MNVRVRRLLLSEKDRVGVGTFQPKDEKNQDSTELTGDINYRKIAEYGSDSDPRAFNFDGEFNVANLLAAIAAMIEDMRGERYAALSPERRIAIYEDYIALKIQAWHDGQFAMRMIAAFSEGGKEAAEREAQKVQ